MEKNSKSFLSSFGNYRHMFSSPQHGSSPQLLNYLSWRKNMNGSASKNMNTTARALSSEKSQTPLHLRTLLGSMSRLKQNLNFSSRNGDKSRKTYGQSSKQLKKQFQRQLIIKSVDQCIPQQSCCQIKIIQSQGSSEKKYEHYLTTTDELRDFLCRKFPSVKAWKTVPMNTPLDYYLTLSDKDISFLNSKQLHLQSYSLSQCEKLSLQCFDIISCLGTGGFSKVYLCRFKGDGKFYAMKVIDKNFILKNHKKDIVMNQKNVMKMLNHPFLIQMKFSFETLNSLVFVIQFCPGGELFGLVKKFKIMEENIARFYIVEMLLGLEEIHSNGVVYRDFKPQNILIDISGHIKIADFGLAKPGIWSTRDKAYSFCGSPEYMPPEMILKKGHSFAVDFYCLGALLYELVTGLPPFYSRNPDEIFDGTVNKPLSFPKHVRLTQELKELLKSLLNKDQGRRLGSYNGIKQVLAHPWFRKINKQTYIKKQISAPVQFESIQDLKLIFHEIEKNNRQHMLDIISQQKMQQNRNFQPKMHDFHYDFRQRTQKSHRTLFRSHKQNNLMGTNSQNYKILGRSSSRGKLMSALSQGKMLKKINSQRVLTSMATRRSKENFGLTQRI